MNSDAFLLSIAYNEALLSPDPSNQNGAILLDSAGRIIGSGCNKPLPKTQFTPEMMLTDRDWKLFNTEHAEREAIYDAVRKQASDHTIIIPGSTLVCPWFACGDCARAIAGTGVRRVIGHKQRMDTTPERWKASVDAGLKLLTDHGVELRFYDGVVDASPIIVNGSLWKP